MTRKRATDQRIFLQLIDLIVGKAIGALRSAQEHNISVPEDLSVAGVDDINQASYSSPPLTTVRIPKSDMAKFTVQTLIDRVSNRNSMSVHLVLPVELIVRGSSGLAPSIPC